MKMETNKKSNVEQEKEFHNKRFGAETDPRENISKWYRAIDYGHKKYKKLICEYGDSKEVLEYGCGMPYDFFDFFMKKLHYKKYVGIDISDVVIEKVKNKTKELELKNTEFIAMNAEAMEFSNETFDLVYGKGILHHLDLEKSISEIARVLKKDGIAIFMEPLGHNWFINKFRSKTPELRTSDEHPLLFSDFDLFKKYFSVDIKLYGFTTLLSVPLLNTPFYKFASFLLQGIDSLLLSIPYFNRNAWIVLLVLRK